MPTSQIRTDFMQSRRHALSNPRGNPNCCELTLRNAVTSLAETILEIVARLFRAMKSRPGTESGLAWCSTHVAKTAKGRVLVRVFENRHCLAALSSRRVGPSILASQGCCDAHE